MLPVYAHSINTINNTQGPLGIPSADGVTALAGASGVQVTVAGDWRVACITWYFGMCSVLKFEGGWMGHWRVVLNLGLWEGRARCP